LQSVESELDVSEENVASIFMVDKQTKQKQNVKQAADKPRTCKI
jgi:hypothetical protein